MVRSKNTITFTADLIVSVGEMKLAKVSEKRLFNSFEEWQIDVDYYMPIAMYLVHGFDPGSFFSAVLANDFNRAIGASHPSNGMLTLKALVGWIVNVMPREAYGSHQTVQAWLSKSSAERRTILEKCGLIFSEQEETWKTITAWHLKN